MKTTTEYDHHNLRTLVSIAIPDGELMSTTQVYQRISDVIVQELSTQWLDKYGADLVESVVPGEIEKEIRTLIARRMTT